MTREAGGTLIVLGNGALDQLPTYLERIDGRRAYLITVRSLAAGHVGERVVEALGDRLVGSYPRAHPHVPVETVDEASREARGLRADAIVGLGGGSPIGTAKAVAFRLRTEGRNDAGPRCAVVAIPTTYAGSEVTPMFGTTDFERGRKEVIRDPGIRPRLALYDPELALDTPPQLTASTGVNALAHCVEALYSKSAGEAERAGALRAANLLIAHLPKSVAEPSNVRHRYRLFEGSMEAGLVLASAGMGVHHGLCHVLGGRFNAPHGVLNAIILPHAMRFNVQVAAGVYRDLAPALGVPVRGVEIFQVGEEVCQAMSEFIRDLDLPQRLRDLGIRRADLQAVAEEALLSKAVQANPRPVKTVQDVLEILEAAW